MGKRIWFVSIEPGIVTQFVPSPVFNPLVCTCKLQPAWSCGHANLIWPALNPTLNNGGTSDTGCPVTGAELALSPAALTAETA
jgi:hypothetical protein